MKTIIIIISIFTIITNSFGQTQEATTEDGKIVILNSDATWLEQARSQDTLSIYQET